MSARPWLFVAIAAASLAATACGDGASPNAKEGDALVPLNRMKLRVTSESAFGPGQTFSFMEVPAVNVSGRPITIRRVEPLLRPGSRRVAEVVSVALAPRTRNLNAHVPLSIYQTHPPTFRTAAGCVSERLVPVEGFVLEPAREPIDAAILVIRIRTRAPGVFRMRGQRVVYEQDGESRYQDLLYELEVTVRAGARREPFEDERRCASG